MTKSSYDNMWEQIKKKIAKLMGDTEDVVLKVYNHVQEERENVEKVVNESIAL